MFDKFLMKGKVWADHKHKLVYPVAAEVKHDEVRLHVARVGDEIHFLSWEGKPLHNLGEWAARFHDAMVEEAIFHLDMGVLVNGNFNDSFRWCRTTTGHPKEKFDKKTGKTAPALFPEMVEFYLFDLPESRSDYANRVFERKLTAATLNDCMIPTSIPDSIICADEEAVNVAFLKFRSLKHEGAMVKNMSHKYKQYGRIDGWLKMKPEAEEDGIVVGFEEAISEDGVPLGRVGSVRVRTEDGTIATPAASTMGHEFAAHVHNNKADYLGEPCMFTYMERDRSGGYRHPIWGRFRESKGMT